MPVDLNRSTEVNEKEEDVIVDMFKYHPWSAEMELRGAHVRDVLMSAVAVIIKNVPPSPDRSTAIRKLREARMDCNSAITHSGQN